LHFFLNDDWPRNTDFNFFFYLLFHSLQESHWVSLNNSVQFISTSFLTFFVWKVPEHFAASPCASVDYKTVLSELRRFCVCLFLWLISLYLFFFYNSWLQNKPQYEASEMCWFINRHPIFSHEHRHHLQRYGPEAWTYVKGPRKFLISEVLFSFQEYIWRNRAYDLAMLCFTSNISMLSLWYFRPNL
jgi:hypothetical protein